MRILLYITTLCFGLCLLTSCSSKNINKCWVAYDAYNSGDYKIAAKNCFRCAMSGDPDAMYFLSNMYSSGRGVNLDLKKSEYWKTMAALWGDSGAQYSLGINFFWGQYGFPENKVEGYKWVKLADLGGFEGADSTLGDFRKAMTFREIQKGEVLAQEFVPKTHFEGTPYF